MLKLSREAAHSQRRIVRVRGDMAGAAIMSALVAAVRRTPSIRVMEGYVAEQLRVEGYYVTGLVARDRRGGLSDRLLFSTRAVVLASGGVGHLYEVTTNPPEARGEGLAMAARAGALVADPEFVQFHPTAVDIGRDPAPLATEALRGEGAIIVDRSGRRFLFDRHADGELAPRDVVARGVHEARVAGRRRLPRLPQGDRRGFRRALPGRLCRLHRGRDRPDATSRSRSRPPRTITWAACTWTARAAPRSTGSGRAARSPPPGRMAQTALPRIRCSRPSSTPRAWRKTSTACLPGHK